jgi:hypothetical protein
VRHASHQLLHHHSQQHHRGSKHGPAHSLRGHKRGATCATKAAKCRLMTSQQL